MEGITWEFFSRSRLSEVLLFEDPLYSAYVEKETFLELYRPVLESLDGGDMCSYVDIYFAPSPLNPSLYLFVDEDARLDFRDYATELGLIPPLVEALEGESRQEKSRREAERKQKEEAESRSREIQRRKAAEKKAKGAKSEDKTRIQTPAGRGQAAQVTLGRLLERLSQEESPAQRENIQRKIDKTLKYIQKSA